MIKCLMIGRDDETCKTIELGIKKIDSMELVGRFARADDALKIISADHIDLLFRDLQLLGKSDLVNLRQRKDDQIYIIAFDQKGESAADAFEMDATDFILKPATTSRTLKAIRKVTAKKDALAKDRNAGNNSLFVKEKGRLIRIFLNDIYLV